MIRKVRFRGQRLTNGEWVYGSLLQQKINGINTDMIMFDRGFGVDKVQIKVGTAGQFTGFVDSYGNDIYEDEILQVGDFKAVVKWNEKLGAFCIQFDFEKEPGFLPLGEWIADKEVVKIIGSIHDKKE